MFKLHIPGLSCVCGVIALYLVLVAFIWGGCSGVRPDGLVKGEFGLVPFSFENSAIINTTSIVIPLAKVLSVVSQPGVQSALSFLSLLERGTVPLAIW